MQTEVRGPGRPADPRVKQYMERFGLTARQRKRLNAKRLGQLDACQSDEARRLLLGVSAPIGAEEE